MRLPKFDTPAWLSAGVLFGALLLALNVWSLVAGWGEPFLPYQLTEFLGGAVGLALSIHCLDMIFYHRRNRSWGKMER